MLLISQYLIRIVNQIRDKKNLSFSHGKNSIELFQKNYVSPSSVEDNGINIENLMEFQGVDEKYWKISGDGESVDGIPGKKGKKNNGKFQGDSEMF